MPQKFGKDCDSHSGEAHIALRSFEDSQDGGISDFREKPEDSASWINGGFFVLEPEVFDYIPDSSNTIWEREPLNNLAEAGQLNAYLHCGFWRPMDMLKDKKDLNDLWSAGRAPWKIWD